MSRGSRHYSLALVCAVLALACLSGCASVTDEPSLVVSAPTLDFGTRATELPLMVGLSGDRTGQMHWRVTGVPTWASVSPTAGSGSAVLNVTVVRSGCGSGDHDADIVIEGPGPARTVHLHMFVGGG
jgi:hypothetical protein